MAKSAPPPPGDEDKNIADANWLMGENAKSKPRSKPKTRSAPPPRKAHPRRRTTVTTWPAERTTSSATATKSSPPVPIPPVPAASRRPKLKDEWDASEAPAPSARG